MGAVDELHEIWLIRTDTDMELNRRVSSELWHKYVLMSIILMYISHLIKNKEKMDKVS